MKLGFELLDVGMEGFFFLLVKLLTSGVDEIVEGYLNKDVAKGGFWWGLEDKVGERAEVVLEGGSGLGDVVLVDSVECGGPRDGGR